MDPFSPLVPPPPPSSQTWLLVHQAFRLDLSLPPPGDTKQFFCQERLER